MYASSDTRSIGTSITEAYFGRNELTDKPNYYLANIIRNKRYGSFIRLWWNWIRYHSVIILWARVVMLVHAVERRRKTISCHNCQLFVAGCTAGCCNDNLCCYQWRQSYHDNSRFPKTFIRCAKTRYVIILLSLCGHASWGRPSTTTSLLPEDHFWEESYE